MQRESKVILHHRSQVLNQKPEHSVIEREPEVVKSSTKDVSVPDNVMSPPSVSSSFRMVDNDFVEIVR